MKIVYIPEVPLYEVEADADTGQWLAEPDNIGQVDLAEFNARQDSSEIMPTTFERDGQTCAVIVHWISAEKQEHNR